MAALTADRDTPRRSDTTYARPQKGGTTLYAGALVALDVNGFAVPGAAVVANITDGVAIRQSVNAGADGAVTVEVRPGTYRFDNSSAGDLITAAQVLDDCYVVDDHTVAKTDNSGARPKAGTIVDVDALGVWVAVGAVKR